MNGIVLFFVIFVLIAFPIVISIIIIRAIINYQARRIAEEIYKKHEEVKYKDMNFLATRIAYEIRSGAPDERSST